MKLADDNSTFPLVGRVCNCQFVNNILYTTRIDIFMIYKHRKLQMPAFIGSLLIAARPETKENLRAIALLLAYIL